MSFLMEHQNVRMIIQYLPGLDYNYLLEIIQLSCSIMMISCDE